MRGLAFARVKTSGHPRTEVRGVRARKIAEGKAERLRGAANLEETDFLEKRTLREGIHAREGGHCSYCLRRRRGASNTSFRARGWDGIASATWSQAARNAIHRKAERLRGGSAEARRLGMTRQGIVQ
jgi:hypothetical protein